MTLTLVVLINSIVTPKIFNITYTFIHAVELHQHRSQHVKGSILRKLLSRQNKKKLRTHQNFPIHPHFKLCM